MNKKFSTLVASLLLAGAVGTVSAAADKGVASSYPREVATTIDGKFYQLSDGYNVLAMEKTANGDFILKFVPYSEAELAKTLWEIRAMENKDEKGLAFQFYNASTGLPLSFDSKLAKKVGETLTATKLSQGVASWSWVRGVEGDPLFNGASIESFFGEKRDSVLTLMNTSEGVGVVKYATKDQASVVSNVQVKPMKASPVYLNAYDLNTMLQTGKSKLHLNFTPNVSADAKINEFTGADEKREFKVTEAVGVNSLSFGSVRDAEADVNEKKVALDGVEAKLNAANAEITALGKDKEEATEAFEAAKQAHQDALNEQTEEQIARDKAAKKIKNNTKKRDAALAEYKEALKAEGVDEVELGKAEKTKNTAEEAFTAAEEAYLPLASEYATLDAEKTRTFSERQVALTEYNTVNYTVKHLTTLTDAAVADAKSKIDAFISAQSSTKAYQWLAKNNQEALAAFEKSLNDAGSLKSYTAAVQNVFLTPYKADQAEKKAVYTAANKAYSTAKKAVEAIEEDYNNALTTYNETKEEKEIAEGNYLTALEKYNGSTGESTRLWDKVKKFQAVIDENEEIRDAADNRLAELKNEIPALWEEVERTGDIYAETLSDFGVLAETLSKLNEEYHIAWYKWNGAVKYLASLDGTDEYWYSLQAADGSYLMVDTAYLESSSSDKHQTFDLKKKYEAAEIKYPGMEKLTARDINGRFNFKFLYYPTIDSLVIMADGGNDKPVNNKTWWHYRPISSVAGKNYVKLAVLGSDKNARREVTLGAPYQIYNGTRWPQQTLNTCISLKLKSATPGADIPAGVYFADIVRSEKNLDPVSRLMLDLKYDFTKVATAEWDVMKFEDMPAAKWVVEENTIYGGSPAIRNQESTELLNNGVYTVLSVKDGVVVLSMPVYNYQGTREDEIIKLTPVTELNHNGYINKGFGINTDSLFTFSYLNAAGNAAVQIGTGNDTIMRVAAGEGTKFVLVNAEKDAQKYGVGKAFEKRIYNIRVNDANKLNNNYKYVAVSNVDGTELMVVSNKVAPTDFYLKEINHVDGTHYYALITADKQYKAGVIDASGLIKAENVMDETRTSAFSLTFETTNYYRKFTADELGEDGVFNFYRANTAEKAYLYAKDNLLQVENKGDNVGDLADLKVLPAVTEGTIMPQYLIARNVVEKKGYIDWCKDGNHATRQDSLDCVHTTIVNDTIFGEFLVNTRINAELHKSTLWENTYTRLAFVKGFAVRDITKEDATYDVVTLGTDAKADAYGKVNLKENAHHAAKFSFRLVDEEEEQNFLIESESWGKTPFDGGVRPFKNGGWIKIQNTVPVIVKQNFEEAVASADLFNVDTNAGSSTANEGIATSEVTIIAGEGQVTIANAAGKKVVISNILGQVVANTVLTSDNATIAAPQGVVVVAVEGEEAVKAIVK